MDIIDIMLARALTPQGKTDIYVGKANKAAEKAAQAEADAQAAVDVVTSAAEDITAARQDAANLLAEAQEALETAQEAQINTLNTEDVDEEIKKLDVSVNLVNGANANTYQVITTYPDNTLHTENATKMYKSEGQNEDGTMTQKAITATLANKADVSTTATKAYVDQKIAAIPAGGGNANIHFTTDDAGHILAVDENGNIVASNITEEVIVDSLITSGNYVAKAAVGLDMDYANKIFTRTQQAANLTMGDDFNQFLMYGGRVKCNVADNGIITAFFGDSNYKEDGSNGQVMIYQPKFYYKRTPYSLENTSKGKIIRHESLILSNVEQAGFKLAPIFDGNLEYVLLPAYDGSLDASNKLASVAGATPLSSITITEAENYAKARGDGWHIVNFAAESANQMLEIVEFGMMNGQIALEQGITSNPSNGNACYFITGSTAALGNGTGAAESTQVVVNGNTSTQTTVGYRAITYRGMENPWGNFWQMIAGVNIYGDGSQGGGAPYICTNYNYTPGIIGDNYEEVGFNLPQEYKWINAMGYGNTKYDWVFLPIECSSGANSLLPIGDSIWITRGLKDINILASGGSYGYGEECGPFYYAVDRNAAASSRVNYGAKLMFIPTKNSIYDSNIAKWSSHVGG